VCPSDPSLWGDHWIAAVGCRLSTSLGELLLDQVVEGPRQVKGATPSGCLGFAAALEARTDRLPPKGNGGYSLVLYVIGLTHAT
jgi:hypothetical protein